MEEVALSAGLYFAGSCSCGGKFQKKYKTNAKKHFMLKIFPNQNKWEIINNGVTLRGNNLSLTTELNAVLAEKLI